MSKVGSKFLKKVVCIFIIFFAGSLYIHTRKFSLLFYSFVVGIPQRLTLFYLANDVIQHSKRKSYEFVDSWATALQRASTLVRDDARVKEKISRIFNIWQQREVYTEDFISDLHGLLAINQVKKPSTSASTSITASPSSSSPIRLATQHQRSDDFDEEFQLTSVVANIRSVVSLESETDKNLKVVVKTSIPDIETVKNNLKGDEKNHFIH